MRKESLAWCLLTLIDKERAGLVLMVARYQQIEAKEQ
jgi:hypothetical protein